MSRSGFGHVVRGVVVLGALAVAGVAGAVSREDAPQEGAAQNQDIGLDHFRRASTNLFAVVTAAGVLVSGNGVAATAQVGPGQYEVTFTRDVSRCAYVATTANAYSQALQAYTAGGHLSSRGVYVETKNQGGGLTDGPFHLIVECGSWSSQYAVVDYDGALVRGSHGAALSHVGVGVYKVRFPRRFPDNLGSCAYLATVGDPANALVFDPSGVYTGSGPDNRTVYIETKNPGGGLQDRVPFHLAVICPSSPKTRVAVVAADGIMDRGSAFTASFRGGPGKYALVTNRDLAGCATVATRGSVDQAVPYYPATVEIVPGPAPNAVGIDMRDLLFFGGAQRDDAFHAVTVCK